MAPLPRNGSDQKGQSQLSSGGSEDSATPLTWLLIFLAVGVQSVVYLVFCTDLTEWGTWVVLQVSSKDQSVHGDFAVGAAVLLAAICYVFDATCWHWLFNVLLGGIIWILLVTGSALKERKYPAVLRVSLFLHLPLMLALVRLRWKKQTRHNSRKRFYSMVGVVCLMFALFWSLAFVGYVFPMTYGPPVFSDSHYWEDSRMRMMLECSHIYEYVLDGVPLSPWDCLTDNPDFVSIKDSATLQNGSWISGELRLKVLAACNQADVVMLLLWLSPLVASLGLLIICILCRCVLADVNALKDGVRATSEVAATYPVMGIAVCFVAMYAATYSTGVTVSLSNGLIALCFWGFSALVIWAPFELSTPEVEHLTEALKSSLQFGTGKVGEVMNNEWVQAMLTGCCLMPSLITLETLRKWFRGRKSCVYYSSDASPFSPPDERGTLLSVESPPKNTFHEIMEIFATYHGGWNWASVLVKVCILGDVHFVLKVGVTKVSYVFLAGMNEYLSQQPYSSSLLIVLIIGLAMLLLPPVPGVLVYMFCGIVLGRERDDSPFGFWGGCAVAVAMGLVLKLIASLGQYAIGYFAGKVVRIQKFVGVGTRNVKAIESILNGDDVTQKMTIFVGGPDWSTRVMSGILKVDLPTMLLLTLPMVTVMAPCVLTGAYMSKVTPMTRNADSWLVDVLMVVAAIGQLGSMVFAGLSITRVVTSGGEDLAKERDEHRAVKELREAEHHYNGLYEAELFKIFDWKDKRRWLIVTAAGLNVLSNYVFTSDFAFENFAVSGKISDPLDEFGLGNNPFNIVRPGGVLALIVFSVSQTLHVVFANLVIREVRATGVRSP